MRYVIYARVSTLLEEQEHSFETQTTDLKNVIQTLHPDYQFIKVYGDQGISGTKEDRPAFQEMIQDAKNEKFDLIVTKSISRFARNTRILLNTIEELNLCNVSILFLEENINTSSVQQKFLLTILGSVAELEATNTREHVKEGFSIKRASGKMARPSAICYGYKIENKNIIIDEEQSKIVRLIFDLFVVENKSPERIAIELNNRGIKTRRGKDWPKTSIIYLLQNKKYIGIAVENDDDKVYEFEGVYPKLIDEAIFSKAQELLNLRHNNRHTKGNFKPQLYPFSGIIKCNCGSKTTRFTRESNLKLDLQEPCNGLALWGCLKKNTVGCKTLLISEFYLYEMVIKALIFAFNNTDITDRGIYWEHFIEPFDKEAEDYDKEYLAYLDKKKELNLLKQKELDLYRAGLIDIKEAEVRVNKIEKSLRELSLPKTPEARTIDAVNLSLFIEAINHKNDAYDYLRELFKDNNIRRQLVKSFIEEITIMENKYEAKIKVKDFGEILCYSTHRSPYKRLDGMHYENIIVKGKV